MRYFPKHLYVWVVFAILLGGAVGYFAPHVAVVLKPLGDGFVSLIKMVVAPVSRVVWEPSESLDDTTRGSGGFGSTGAS